MNDTQSYTDKAPPTRPTILSTYEDMVNQLAILEKEVEALSQALNPILTPSTMLKGAQTPGHIQASPTSELGNKLSTVEERIRSLSSRVTDIGQRVAL